MLTNNELKAIKDIVTETVGVQISPIITRLDRIEKDLKPIKSIQQDIKKIRKTTDMMGRLFDKADVNLYKRVQKIEEHLHLESPKN